MLTVWLPLLGNTNNQGLSTQAFAVSNTSYITVDNNGKLGKCYNFNSSATNNGIFSADGGFMANYINNKSWSLCAWINTTATDTIVISLSYGLMFRAGNTSNTVVTLYNSSRSVNCTSSVAVNDGKWHHICATYDVTNNAIKYYVDGVNTGSATYTSGYTYASSWANGLFVGRDPNNSAINDHYLFKGKLNDVRIYSGEALSQKQVKLLSQGLVVHYTLGNRFLEGTTNLCTTSDCLSSTCYNGANGKYGYGTGTDMYKTTGTFNGKFCTKLYMGTSGNSARPYPYVNNMFVSNGTNQPKNKTISFDYYGTIGTYINPYKLGSGSATCDWRNNATATKSGTFTNSGQIPVVPNMWNHISFTLTGTTDANAEWGYIILGDTHTSDTSNYWLFANFQIEAKDHETGYAGVGGTRNDTTVYDSSGYNYHGTINTAMSVSSNTSRYSSSMSFNGTDNAITIPYNTMCPLNIFTVNVWFYKTAVGSKNYETLFGGPSGFEMDTRAGTATTLSLYMASTRGGILYEPLEFNKWNMITMVRDDTNELYYVNGELKKTITAKAMPTGTYFIGSWRDVSSQNYCGLISDFRLYSTCLSAEDVKALYQVGASIDKSGNMYAYEFNEV